MTTVLINAYACAPNKGSEPGMAWNWIIHLGKHCQLHVITEGEWREDIEKALPTIPQGKNIRFYYNPVSDKIRKMCWNQGDWRFYYYYRRWQKETHQLAKEIIVQNKIDLLHQLNMVGYREPGLLWKNQRIPTIWGPVGGFGQVPITFLSLYTPFGAVKQIIKHIINCFQIYSPNIYKAIKKMDAIVACNSEARLALQKFRSDIVYHIHEVGSFNNNQHETRDLTFFFEPLRLLWIGRNIESKALRLAIESFNRLSDLNVELHIIGVSSESVNYEIRNNNVHFYSWLPHQETQDLFRKGHLLFFTSLYEATGTVILESLSIGVPILCHDTCGQGDIVDNSCGIKIPLENPKRSIEEFCKAIREVNKNRALLKQMSEGAYKKSKEVSWKRNVEKMLDIYKNTLK